MVNHPNRSKHSWGAPRSPKPAEIIAAREAAGLTQTEAAELIYATLHAWQKWEAPAGAENARAMNPALWELWRQKVSLSRPRIPADWFGEKTHQVATGSIMAFGIHLVSRYDNARELAELLEFAECAARQGCEKYVKRAFYDSKACVCTFDLAPEVRDGDPIATKLRACADKKIGQFDWFGIIGGKHTI
jgi:putative transcriptional regulator